MGWLCFMIACSPGNQETPEDDQVAERDSMNNQEGLFTNPVFEPVLADPTIISANGYFYAFGTEDNWGSEGGYHLVPVIRSSDLIHWDFVADAFQTKPDWKSKGGIWAPDVTPVGDQYYMYYSFSTWGDPNPGIGLAIAQNPEGPYFDQGKVFLSEEIDVANSIDPFYWEEDNQKYLFWGSFNGIYAVPLTDDGTQVAGEKVKVADNHLEATYIHKREQYYYLFGSEGSCCEGAESTYHIRVGRSTALLGPYQDKDGNLLTEGAFGELLLEGQSGEQGFSGPGHNAEIITDDDGTDWLLYHAIRKEKPRLENGASRRPLMLDEIHWENGWPVIAYRQPGIEPAEGPVFQ
ncbi:MAG: family 43 glycosylhydrolase [Cyclobacteriaceae bacterium]